MQGGANNQAAPLHSPSPLGARPRHGQGLGALDMDALKQNILAAHAGTGEVARVLREAAFVPRHNAFTSLLQLASKSRQPDKAVEIFDAMQTVAGIAPNTFSYSALISALARAGQWQQAERYFNELLQKSATDETCRPNTVTYAALISGEPPPPPPALRLAARPPPPPAACRSTRPLLNPPLPLPTLPATPPAPAAYEKGRQLEKALKAFQRQLENDVEPDVITFSSLIAACERAGSVERAVWLLDMMHALGLAGPQQMYCGVLAACGPRWEPALEVFLGMQCAGVDATPQAAALLLTALAAGGQRDHALALLREAREARFALAHASLGATMRMLGDRGDAAGADFVLGYMRAAGVHVDAVVAWWAVEAHARGGDPEGAAALAQQFQRAGVHPRRPDGDGGRPPPPPGEPPRAAAKAESATYSASVESASTVNGCGADGSKDADGSKGADGSQGADGIAADAGQSDG